MTKQEFIEALEKELSGLPENDVKERVAFYIEMIDDRIEEGLTEADGVAAIGSVDSTAAQIRAEIDPPSPATMKKKSKRKMKAWEIVLLALGAPLWLPLLIAALAIIFSLYVTIWSVVISLWAVGASLVGCAIGGIFGGINLIIFGNALSGVVLMAVGITSAGLAIFMFFGCRETTRGTVWLTKLPFVIIKKRCAERRGDDEEIN